jgi:hypothetical protein
MLAILIAVAVRHEDYAAIHRTMQQFGKAKSVSGVLACDSYGSKETWTFSIGLGGARELTTPYRIISAGAGRYLIFQPFDKGLYQQDLPPNTTMDIPELWPFNVMGSIGDTPQFLRTKSAPRKVQFGGKTAWEIGGLAVPDGQAQVFLDATTGELLGWNESYGGGGWNRQIAVKSLTWNKPVPALFTPPKGVHPVRLDDLMYLPIGQPMPDALLVDEHGGKTSLSRLLAGSNGAVISIGSAGCGPCEASKRFAARNLAAFSAKRVKFVALESWGCTQAQLAEITKSNPVPFHSYRAVQDDLRFRYRLAGAPTVYFLDGEHRVVRAQQGFEPAAFRTSLGSLGLIGLKN